MVCCWELRSNVTASTTSWRCACREVTHPSVEGPNRRWECSLPWMQVFLSFLRRKTDFYVGASPDKVEETVLAAVRKQVGRISTAGLVSGLSDLNGDLRMVAACPD
jgi:hypothetical protein